MDGAYPLTAAALVWAGKTIYELVKMRNSNGNGNGNGKVSISDIKLAVAEAKEDGVKTIREDIKHNQDEIVELLRESNLYLAELVYSNRQKR